MIRLLFSQPQKQHNMMMFWTWKINKSFWDLFSSIFNGSWPRHYAILRNTEETMYFRTLDRVQCKVSAPTRESREVILTTCSTNIIYTALSKIAAITASNNLQGTAGHSTHMTQGRYMACLVIAMQNCIPLLLEKFPVSQYLIQNI